MKTLVNKTLFITGASRGIGRAIALRAAADGARIAIVAKTDKPHPTLPGTIHTVASEIVDAGGEALPIPVDIRRDDEIAKAVRDTVERFGGIDIVINNASALDLSTTLNLPMSRFDLMFDINVRGTFAVTRACLPHLRRSANPHILTMSPPLDLVPTWFGEHCAYTVSKYAMSMTVLGFAEEFHGDGVAVNALWPQTMIETAASRLLGMPQSACRWPEIMADAAHAVLVQPARACTGNFFIDEDVLRAAGLRNFDKYATTLGVDLALDLFVREPEGVNRND
ncbi:citronellol/citronellal dehydrogenase [Methylobacterium sp. OAE515]|uniref:SDR family oxidoreductase n=1 Tax=Methylobacterium sp. OAE515 TaxID=2817895 RepID=UPI0017890CFB